MRLGSIAALKGHEVLREDKGTLHSDINPGNIFLDQPGYAGSREGFITDLELASVVLPKTETMISLDQLPLSVDQPNTRGEETILSSSRAPGAEITGTALFMAGGLLEKMLRSDKNLKGTVRLAKIERGVHHDLESFILVLFHAVMKHDLERGVSNHSRCAGRYFGKPDGWIIFDVSSECPIPGLAKRVMYDHDPDVTTIFSEETGGFDDHPAQSFTSPADSDTDPSFVNESMGVSDPDCTHFSGRAFTVI